MAAKSTSKPKRSAVSQTAKTVQTPKAKPAKKPAAKTRSSTATSKSIRQNSRSATASTVEVMVVIFTALSLVFLAVAYNTVSL